ncbi:hypothetical protein NZ698_18550 [Chryseobacterium sp. PBS4-4]|uniref:Peptide-binding protein n=1 Tax=Chryseobacterium edaphi TaxID=2976532 RepID=A0ABT2WB11_9FLAO|nr:hypothetical protein [Chryseobacterium edaphi]MCU7619184.1 hypothetical protein [Chryseobacterium edaphi]
MKTTKTSVLKFVLILFLMLMSITEINAQTKFRAKDLDGTWIRQDGMKINILGADLFDGTLATIQNVGNSGWPKSVVGYLYKFTQIKYVSGNTWKAVNNVYRQQNGHTVEQGEVLLKMKDDKQSFEVGNDVYKKN